MRDAEVSLEVRRRLAVAELRKLALLRLVRQPRELFGLARRFALLPELVSGAVLLRAPQISDDDLVERAHRFTEADGVLDLTVEAHALAREVRRERESRAAVARDDLAPREVAETDLGHAITSTSM